MKHWKLELDDDEVWWIDDALGLAQRNQEDLAAHAADDGTRWAALEGARRFRQIREERLRPLVELVDRVREAPRAGAAVDPEERDDR